MAENLVNVLMQLSSNVEQRKTRKLQERQLEIQEKAFANKEVEWNLDTELRELVRQSKSQEALLTKEQHLESSRRIKAIKGLKDTNYDLYIDWATRGLATKALQQKLGIADQAIRQMSAESNMLRTQMSVQKNIRDSIDKGQDAIYSIENLPADLKLMYGREMKNTLTGIAIGKFDPNTMRTPVQIQESIREGIEKERDRLLSVKVEGEQRVAETKAKGARESTAAQFETDKEEFEFGSLQEVETARMNLQATPEVRKVYYDPKGIGIRTKTDDKGRRIPPAYQKGGYKWMTERRAVELGLQEDWASAGGSSSPLDLSQSSLQDLLRE